MKFGVTEALIYTYFQVKAGRGKRKIVTPRPPRVRGKP